MLPCVTPSRSLSTQATERRQFDAHHFACRVERHKHGIHFSSFLPAYWWLMKFSVKYRCDFLLYRLRWSDWLMINRSMVLHCCVMPRVACYFRGQRYRVLPCNDVFSPCMNAFYTHYSGILSNPVGSSVSNIF